MVGSLGQGMKKIHAVAAGPLEVGLPPSPGVTHSPDGNFRHTADLYVRLHDLSHLTCPMGRTQHSTEGS